MNKLNEQKNIQIDLISGGSLIIHQLMTTLNQVFIVLSLLALARADPTLTTSESWGYGFLAGFCLSLLGFVAAILLICFQKCLSESCFKHFVSMLYALACGAIIGDAMIHILPEAYKSEATNTRYVSLIFICAVAFFIILERVFKSCGIAHEHWGEDHSHSEQKEAPRIQNQPEECQQAGRKVQNLENKPKSEPTKQVQQKIDNSSKVLLGTTDKVNDPNNSDSDTADQEKTCLENLKGKGAAGYLNLLSSFVHNFFDGFGIGVGFASRDPQIIVPIVIAIVAHEIPREMGDVGFLVKNGFSNVQTVLCNGFINFMSLIGVFAGLALGTIGEATQNYVMVFVAGNFMYIGADIWKHLLAHKQFLLNLAEIVMFSLGVGAMFMVLLAEG